MRRVEEQAFLGALTDEELWWMAEPLEEATAGVDCPRHGPGCDCQSDERTRTGFEKHPKLAAEYERRRTVLKIEKEGA